MGQATTFLTLGELRDQIESLLSSGQVQLPIESGIYKTDGKKGWQTVYFSKRFITTPSVIAQGTFKSGSFPQIAVDIPTMAIPPITLPSIEIPSITVPNVTVPTIPYRIPRLDIRTAITGYSTISEYMAYENRASFYAHTDWWNYTLVLIPIREAIAAVAFGIGAFVGSFLDWFVNSYIQPHFDNVESTLRGVRDIINSDIIGSASSPKAGSVNRAFDDLEDALQSALDEITSGVNTGYETFKGSVEGAFEGVTGQINEAFGQTEKEIENAINNQVSRLYEYLGVLDGAPFVPTKIANVSSAGFHLYSTGAPEYHWVAIGV